MSNLLELQGSFNPVSSYKLPKPRAMEGKNLTCRHWKLSQLACLKDTAECPYAHHDTGIIGPPANITCWAWKNGGCKLHDEGCLFSHSDTGVVQSLPNPTRRMSSASSITNSANPLAISMTGKNLAIAKAAAKAGFECSDVERLMILVNAVRDANLAASYVSHPFPVIVPPLDTLHEVCDLSRQHLR